MKSKLFNQIRLNRQRYYSRIYEEMVEAAFDINVSPEMNPSEPEEYFKLRLNIPEIPIREITGKLKESSLMLFRFCKPYVKRLAIFCRKSMISAGNKMNLVYQKGVKIADFYCEKFQMFVYCQFIVLFEDASSEESVEESGTIHTAQNRSEGIEEKTAVNNWFSRLYGRMLISLELDQPEFRIKKEATAEPEIAEAPKPSGLKQKYVMIMRSLKYRLVTMFQIIHPVKYLRRDFSSINRFV